MPNYQLIVYYILFSSILVYGWFPSNIPEYCSKNMLDRYIVPLSDEQKKQVSKLIQVQVMIRHGARTPVSQQCWKQYHIDWHNCNISTSLQRYESYNTKEDKLNNTYSSWLIEKQYEEAYNGNCILGQLLTEGLEQESINGDILRSAYLNHNHNSNFRLFDTATTTRSNKVLMLDQLSLYSDDMERTLLSGQTVINSMLSLSTTDVVHWNIIDYFYDWSTCSSLHELVKQAYTSSEFITINNSIDNIKATNDLNILWGQDDWTWGTSLDCVMTTVCSERQLPPALNSDSIVNNEDKISMIMNDDLLNRIIEHDEFTYKYLFNYKNQLIAKSTISKVALKMRLHIENLIESYKSPHKTSKYSNFILFSAHDTNIMPLLALILGCNWDGKRAPYAALVSIEIYVAAVDANDHTATADEEKSHIDKTVVTTSFDHINTDNNIESIIKNDDDDDDDIEFYFRLIYNGKPQKIPACKDTLCNLNILFNALQSAIVDNICTRSKASQASSNNSMINNSNIVNFNMEWLLSMIFILLLGLLIGASIMFFVTKYSMIPTTTSTTASSSTRYHDINQYTAIQTSGDMADQVEIELTQALDAAAADDDNTYRL